MPNTAFQNLYAAAKAILADVATSASATIAQATTNYGDDFKITPGTTDYQIRIAPQRDRVNSNVSYPRAIVTVAMHHYVSSLSNEEAFLHVEMQAASDALLVESVWQAETGIYGFQTGIEPEINDGARVGNVISFEASAVVLMTPA
jgi:hypothetical protein